MTIRVLDTSLGCSRNWLRGCSHRGTGSEVAATAVTGSEVAATAVTGSEVATVAPTGSEVAAIAETGSDVEVAAEIGSEISRMQVWRVRSPVLLSAISIPECVIISPGADGEDAEWRIMRMMRMEDGEVEGQRAWLE